MMLADYDSIKETQHRHIAQNIPQVECSLKTPDQLKKVMGTVGYRAPEVRSVCLCARERISEFERRREREERERELNEKEEREESERELSEKEEREESERELSEREETPRVRKRRVREESEKEERGWRVREESERE